MKITIKRKVDVEAKTLHVEAGVRYWEDATVNGVEDEMGDLIPCRLGDDWCPVIDLDSGVITNWTLGTVADVHYKVCDEGRYVVKDAQGAPLLKKRWLCAGILPWGRLRRLSHFAN